MLARPGPVKARIDDRTTTASRCRSYSPLEGRPAHAGTHNSFIAEQPAPIKR